MAVVITAIDPNKGDAGAFVTITGSGFTGARDVFFGANTCGLRYEVIADDTIVCYVPEGNGTVAVKVAGAAGPSFTYATTMPAPTVAAITPNTGSSGDTVAITGTGLARTRSVTFDGLEAAFAVVSDTAVDVLVPAGSGAVTVALTTPYGSATKTFTYAALPVPTLASVTPNKGFPGDACTLTGAGLLQAHNVAFGGVSASFMVASDTTIVCYVPDDAPAGSCNVTVAGAGGDSAAVAFTVGAVALPRTTATGVQKSAYDGWATGPVTVTLTADANGGAGVAGTFYQLDNGGITPYAVAFQVTGAGSHHVVWWSVDVRGKVEPPQSGYVNILAASLVPTGLSVVTAGFDAVLAKWTAVASDSPVSYRLYQGPAATGPWTKVSDTVANVVNVPQLATAGAEYYAVAGVDKNGTESSKSAAFGPITAAAVPTPTVDWAAMPPITTTQIADDAITTPKIGANQVTAAEINVASIQAAVVTAAAVNAVAINAGSITAGTIATARLDVAAIQAATVTATAVNALALNASVISAGTIMADHLDVAGLKAQLITAANINALNLNAVNITGGTIKGVVIEGGTIRTAAATLKRVEIASSDNSIKFWSMDSQEASPATLMPYVYGAGQGGYLSIVGPKVTGQVATSYISLHGTTTRKDVLITAMGGGSITVGPVSYPGDVQVGDNLRVSGRVIAGEVGNRRDPVLISHDFQGTSMCYATGGTEVGDSFWNYDITNGLASSGGATALDVAGHVGIIQFYSASAAANSGRSILTNGSTIRLQSGDVMEFSFMCPSVAASCRTRLGHFDTTTTGTPANGAYLNIAGATLRGYVDVTSTGTTYTLTAGVWYGARIEVVGSTVVFTLFDSGLNTATVLWTSTVAAAPYGAAFFGMATYNTAASNIYTLAIDYMGLCCSPRNR